MNAPPERIAAPEPPSPATPHGFPVLATIAPVVASVALWLLTQSVFALLFAVLGPVVAVSSLADGRIQSRRRLRRERARFAADAVAVESDIDAAHDRERAWADARAPSAITLVEGDWPVAEYWRGGSVGGRVGDGVGGGEPAGLRGAPPVPVRLGRGDRPSTVELDGASGARRSDVPTRTGLELLRRRGATLRDAPVVVDAALGIGIVGAPVLAHALARAVVVQLAATLPPTGISIGLDAESRHRARWRWLSALPHGRHGGGAPDSEGEAGGGDVAGGDAVVDVAAVDDAGGGDAGGAESGAATVVTFHADAAAHSIALVAVAAEPSGLPASSRIVVEVRGGAVRLLQQPGGGMPGEGNAELRGELVSEAQARRWAASLAALAERTGVSASSTDPPDSVAFGELAIPVSRPLDCAVARTAGGVLRLDLVAQGPHAVVGGTTGSGKSELLVAWVLAMAAAHPPRDLSVLLVDFKGGSAFASLEALPHCVGVITDLDDATALRALESLAAELRRRELHLAEHRARSVDELEGGGRLPRLVIVVDEFAAMVAGFPDLHALFSDIAARGRSLGVHLVLCTQRPAGVIRDAVLANSALRISLRVNNRSDSTAVIGSDAAAALPASRRGRALVSADGEEPLAAQFPLVTRDDIARVAGSWAHDDYRAHRPWRDPLPPVVRASELPRHLGPADSGIPFGLADDPSRQSQPLACYRPTEHGNLLVVGGSGSGKTTLLATIAAAAPAALLLSADIERAWDALVELVGAAPAAAARHAAPASHRLLLIDDLDVLLSRFPEDYEAAVLGMLARVLREGPARSLRCVVGAQRLTPQLHAIAALCGSRLLLRLPNRQEHVIAGGEASRYVDRARPGEGTWEGLRVQVAIGERTTPEPGRGPSAGPAAAGTPLSRPARIDPAHPMAVVSSRPADFVRRLRQAAPGFAAANAVMLIGQGSPSPQELTVSAGPRPRALVGDAEGWQAHWGAVMSLRSTHQVIVDGYPAADFRALTRLRELPPPLNPGSAAFWLLTSDGRVCRARLG